MDVFMPGTAPNRVSIQFNGFERMSLHASGVPRGALTLEHRAGDGSVAKKMVWAKVIGNPAHAFGEMQRAYQAMAAIDSHRHMPVPFCFDPAEQVLYTSFVPGTSLVRLTIQALLLRVRRLPDWLVQVYRNLGEWLSTYHIAMASSEKIRLADLLDETERALATDSYFDDSEKRQLLGHLQRMRQPHWNEYRMTLTRPHNDFCLRNIMMGTTSDFSVVDWDAMVHPLFPQTATIWNDLVCFYTNTQSLLRFYPAISAKQIRVLLDSFLSGYFSGKHLDEVPDARPLIWLFALQYLIGLIGDRPLYKIYQKRLTSRYVTALRKTLLLKEHDITRSYRR